MGEKKREEELGNPRRRGKKKHRGEKHEEQKGRGKEEVGIDHVWIRERKERQWGQKERVMRCIQQHR